MKVMTYRRLFFRVVIEKRQRIRNYLTRNFIGALKSVHVL